jgi:hypothetical protein
MLERKCVAKEPELRHNHSWLLHHDVPTHTSLEITDFGLATIWLLFPIHPTRRTKLLEISLFQKLKIKLKA